MNSASRKVWFELTKKLSYLCKLKGMDRTVIALELEFSCNELAKNYFTAFDGMLSRLSKCVN